jgi:hypothetical protein
VLDRGGGGSECSGDVARGDVVGVARGIEVTVQWAVGWCVVFAKVKDTALGRPDWAESVVAGAAVAKGLASCCILLVGVGETDVSPVLHVIQRASERGRFGCVWRIVERACRMVMLTGQTRDGAGSSSAQALKRVRSRKTYLVPSNRGSWRPSRANSCPTASRASSTRLDRTGSVLRERTP